MKGIVLGIKVQEYTKNGVQKVAREVYVLKDAPKNPVDGMDGRPCEVIFVPFEIPAGVKKDMYCDIVYRVIDPDMAVAFTIDYTPSVKAKMGTYVVFGNVVED